MSEKEQKHTAEPWHYLEIIGACFVKAGHREVLAYKYSPDAENRANARRLVACVNACAGMADPDYEIDKMRTELAAVTTGGIAADDALYHGNSVRHWYDKAHAYRDAAGDLHSVTKQRDALLSALKDCLLEHGGYTIRGECERKARAAIAAATK